MELLAKPIRLLPTIAALLLPALGLRAAYSVGDIMSNFTLTDRATGGDVSLYDYEGQVVFLDFFAVWCPYCVAAAPQIESGVVGYFEARGGENNAELPVTRIAMNLQADTGRYQSANDTFIGTYGLDPVLQDTQRLVANQFVSGGQPIFVVVNGVADSPSHEQWEILYIRSGFGSSSAPTGEIRSAIDSVLAPAPDPDTAVAIADASWRGADGIQFRITGNNRDRIELQRSVDLENWSDVDVAIPVEESTTVQVSLANISAWGYLRAVRAP